MYREWNFVQKLWFADPTPNKDINNQYLRLSSWWCFTPLKNMSQTGSFPQVGLKIKRYLRPPPREWNSSKTMACLHPKQRHQQLIPEAIVYSILKWLDLHLSHRLKENWHLSRDRLASHLPYGKNEHVSSLQQECWWKKSNPNWGWYSRYSLFRFLTGLYKTI